MVIGIRVESENIQSGATKHCNSSYFTMVAKDDDGNTTDVPGLILESKEDVRRFLRSIERFKKKKERSSKYGADFKLEAHISELEGTNTRLLLS